MSERSFSSGGTSLATETTPTGDPFATGNAILQDALFTTSATTTTRTTTVRTVTEIFEQGMEGWDAEISALIPGLDQWMDARVIAGYYSFDNQPFGPQEFGTGNVHSWKAGLELRPVPAVVLSGTWYEDKRLTGGNWTVGVQLQVPLDLSWRDAFTPRRRHLVEHLAEPVHRQNDAVKIGNEKEEHSTSSTSVKRVTRVVSQTPGRVVLQDDVIFVNNGGDVGNGIKAGDEKTGDGTAEKPKAVIQTGANLAQANSNSTGRVWNVYTQGTVAGYTEDITASIGSVNFIGSGQLIQGLGGRNFGKGIAPVVNGGFFADDIRFFGVTGYTINFGTSSGHALDDAIHVHVADGGIVNIIGNTINDAITDAIYVTAFTGTAQSTITISGNTINDPGVHGIHLDTDADTAVKLIVANNTVTGAGVPGGDDGIVVETYSTAPLTASFINNTVTGSGNDGVNIYAGTKNTTLNLTFTGNKFLNNDGDGVDFDTDGVNVKWNFNFTGNTFSGNRDSGLDLKLETAPGQVLAGNISGNSFIGAVKANENLIIQLDSGASGPRSSFTGTISGNTFNDAATDAISIFADGTSATAGQNTVVDAIISGNTFHNAGFDYIHSKSFGTSSVTLNIIGNDFHSATNSAIFAKSFDTSTMDVTVKGNTISEPGATAITVGSDPGTASHFTGVITGNTITAALTGIQTSLNSTIGGTVTIADNLLGGVTGSAIDVTVDGGAANTAIINGNTITGPLSTGISLVRFGGSLDINPATSLLNNSVTGATVDSLFINGSGITGGIKLNGSIINPPVTTP